MSISVFVTNTSSCSVRRMSLSKPKENIFHLFYMNILQEVAQKKKKTTELMAACQLHHLY